MKDILKNVDNLYHALFNNSNDIIIELTALFEIHSVNKIGLKHLQCSLDEIKSQPFDACSIFKVKGLSPNIFLQLKKGISISNKKITIKLKNSSFLMESSFFPCLNEENVLSSVIIIGKDISTSQNQFYLQQLIDQVPASLYILNKNEQVQTCNQFGAELFGMKSPSELIGKSLFSFSSGKKVMQIRKNDMEVLKKGKTISVEESMKFPDGSVIIGISSKAPLRNEKGKITGIIGATLDITAQRLAETRAKEAIEIAKEADELRERVQTMELLGGSIAHEIRNPLLAIRSSAKIIGKYLPSLLNAYEYALQTGADLDEIHPETLEILANSVNDIDSEINLSNTFIDVLLSKIRNNIDNYELETCSMQKSIEDALKRYPFQKQKHRSLISWNKDQDFTFTGNETLMIHVLFNLLKNSLFYIDTAGKGEITLWVDEDSTFHYLHFKDTGTGISAEVLPNLFTRFYSQTRYGTGLGLSFCKMVMQGLGGDIICQSVEHEYTDFILQFKK